MEKANPSEAALKIWGQVTDARRNSELGAKFEIRVTRSKGKVPSRWAFNGRGVKLEDYGQWLGFPVLDFVRDSVAAAEGNEILLVDLATSHTDPLVSANNIPGIPARSIRGRSLGLSFMGTRDERRKARALDVTFQAADLMGPMYTYFPSVDRWRRKKPIRLVISRLGNPDEMFQNIPPYIHSRLGAWYQRLDPNGGMMVLEVPYDYETHTLQDYCETLSTHFNIAIKLNLGPWSSFEKDPEKIRNFRSIVIRRDFNSSDFWPSFRLVNGQMVKAF